MNRIVKYFIHPIITVLLRPILNLKTEDNTSIQDNFKPHKFNLFGHFPFYKLAVLSG